MEGKTYEICSYIRYIIRGSRKAKKPDLDYIDEEDIIQWVCKNENYGCICDFCMGQGLVGKYAAQAGRKFVGGELNHRRLSVLLRNVPGYEILKRDKKVRTCTATSRCGKR